MSPWKTVTLGDVADFVRGITFKPEDVVAVGTQGSVACMRTKNVQADLDQADVWGIAERFVRRPDQFLRRGDILVSSANSWNLVGKCSWIPDLPWRSTFGGFVSVLRARAGKADPRFLYHWFSSDRIQATLRSFGQKTTNISNLNIDRCLALELPLPELREQVRIAKLLDAAQELRNQRQAALVLVDSMKAAMFEQLCLSGERSPSWQSVKLGNVAEFVRGITFKPEDVVPVGTADSVACMRTKNVQRELDKDDVWGVPERFVRRPEQYLRRGDTLVSSANSWNLVGKCSWVPDLPWRATFGGFVSVLRASTDSRVDSCFLYLWFSSARVQTTLRSFGQKTTSISNLNIDRCLSLELRIPPLPIQRDLARRSDAAEALKATHGASLDEMDALFATIQRRALGGELSR